MNLKSQNSRDWEKGSTSLPSGPGGTSISYTDVLTSLLNSPNWSGVGVRIRQARVCRGKFVSTVLRGKSGVVFRGADRGYGESPDRRVRGLQSRETERVNGMVKMAQCSPGSSLVR